ncbi:Nucleoside-diphosphate-sugar epimerase [Actinokineospora alba]|uniref:Nucleoside-diphosphate-sugar epimerase n=1 Tax=Actinokineospora alba TaxID=504798 RepID=A0A1H0IBU2_9PSEU|nr:NAD-dependent epimerase/dehydratase family protein [Actinokineospora alba]TDP71010.1 nucleoside-diphosphate-sugar epimerase [Actinokineospora alba]SDI88043.1 Nucleoside-diphosphate-sugar epimerase [Actinokineospora alba]SDO28730.1 Nucleoside-diphosphate-sugar epimerase [Actinokineospora alba]
MGHVCVIGGTRFFGKTLVRRLLGEGHKVTVLTRGRSGDDFGHTVSRLSADANDVVALSEAVAGHEFDAVVHQMCYSPVAALAAAKAFQGRTRRLVMTSTIEVYTTVPGVRSFAAATELDPADHGYDVSLPWLDPDFAGAHYGEGKRQAESALTDAADFPVAFARAGHVLAEGEFTGRLAFHVDRVLAGSRIATHRAPGRSSFVHSEEIAGFLAWLSESSVTGPVNAASPDGLSARDLCAVIEDVTGRAAVIEEVDDPLGDADLSPFSYPTDFGMVVEHEFSPVRAWLPEVVRREVGAR